jgi:triacylglycerol lipase
MDGSRPVILVHGILGQRHLYWNIFKHRLHKAGYRYHDCVLPYGLLGDMRVAARFLKDKVENALMHDHADKVNLVCHSAGGLVARYFLMYLGGHRLVDNIVTLGTPHQGTYFAYVLPVPLLQIAKQTRPGSHFLGEVNGDGHLPIGVKFWNIWSPIDGVVFPSHNSKLAGSKAIKLAWTTHWGFLWQKSVFDHVAACLGPPGQP